MDKRQFIQTGIDRGYSKNEITMQMDKYRKKGYSFTDDERPQFTPYNILNSEVSVTEEQGVMLEEDPQGQALRKLHAYQGAKRGDSIHTIHADTNADLYDAEIKLEEGISEDKDIDAVAVLNKRIEELDADEDNYHISNQERYQITNPEDKRTFIQTENISGVIDHVYFLRSTDEYAEEVLTGTGEKQFEYDLLGNVKKGSGDSTGNWEHGLYNIKSDQNIIDYWQRNAFTDNPESWNKVLEIYNQRKAVNEIAGTAYDYSDEGWWTKAGAGAMQSLPYMTELTMAGLIPYVGTGAAVGYAQQQGAGSILNSALSDLEAQGIDLTTLTPNMKKQILTMAEIGGTIYAGVEYIGGFKPVSAKNFTRDFYKPILDRFTKEYSSKVTKSALGKATKDLGRRAVTMIGVETLEEGLQQIVEESTRRNIQGIDEERNIVQNIIDGLQDQANVDTILELGDEGIEMMKEAFPSILITMGLPVATVSAFSRETQEAVRNIREGDAFRELDSVTKKKNIITELTEQGVPAEVAEDIATEAVSAKTNDEITSVLNMVNKALGTNFTGKEETFKVMLQGDWKSHKTLSDAELDELVKNHPEIAEDFKLGVKGDARTKAVKEARERYNAWAKNNSDKQYSDFLIRQKLPDISLIGSTNLDTQIKFAKKALSRIAPNVKFEVHETSQAFYEATGISKEQGFTDSGYYDFKTNTIHINKQFAQTDRRGNTVAHEAFHALLKNILPQENMQEEIERILSAVYKVASNKLKNRIDSFKENYDKNVQSEEALAELVSILVSSHIQIASVRSQIKMFLQKIASLLGFKNVFFETDTEVFEFLNSLRNSLRKGVPLTQEDISLFEENMFNEEKNNSERDEGRRQKLKQSDSFNDNVFDETIDALRTDQEVVETSPFEGGKVRTIAFIFHRLMQDRIDFTDKKEKKENAKKLGERISQYLNIASQVFPDFESWYESRINMAMNIFEELDPELRNPENKFVMLVLLTVTSNGNSVTDQTRNSWDLYQDWKKTGKLLSTTVTIDGTRRPDITKALRRMDTMIENYGWETMQDFLSKSGTVRQLRKDMESMGFTKKEAEDLTKGELINEEVPYALIFGAKLGSFYNNLNGNFDTITMDRWFMRTFGRLAGSQLRKLDDKAIQKQIDALKDAEVALNFAIDQGTVRTPPIYNKLKIDITQPYDLTSNEIAQIEKYYTKAENRKGLSTQEDNFRKAINNRYKFIDGYQLMDAPKNGTHRNFIRLAMKEGLDQYNSTTGSNLNLAEAQAMLWYLEKIIHKSYGSQKSGETNPDYGSAANDVYRRERSEDALSFESTDTLQRGETLRRSVGELGETSQGRSQKQREDTAENFDKIISNFSFKGLDRILKNMGINYARPQDATTIRGLVLNILNSDEFKVDGEFSVDKFNTIVTARANKLLAQGLENGFESASIDTNLYLQIAILLGYKTEQYRQTLADFNKGLATASELQNIRTELLNLTDADAMLAKSVGTTLGARKHMHKVFSAEAILKQFASAKGRFLTEEERDEIIEQVEEIFDTTTQLDNLYDMEDTEYDSQAGEISDSYLDDIEDDELNNNGKKYGSTFESTKEKIKSGFNKLKSVISGKFGRRQIIPDERFVGGLDTSKYKGREEVLIARLAEFVVIRYIREGERVQRIRDPRTGKFKLSKPIDKEQVYKDVQELLGQSELEFSIDEIKKAIARETLPAFSLKKQYVAFMTLLKIASNKDTAVAKFAERLFTQEAKDGKIQPKTLKELMNALDEMSANLDELSNSINTIYDDETIRELNKKINDIKARIRTLQNPKTSKREKSKVITELEQELKDLRRIQQLENEIEKLQDILDSGRLEDLIKDKKLPKVTERNKKIIELIKKRNRLNAQLQSKLKNIEEENNTFSIMGVPLERTIFGKHIRVSEAFARDLFGFPRLMLAMADMSAILRQMAILTPLIMIRSAKGMQAKYPILTSKTFQQSFKSFWSKNTSEELDAMIQMEAERLRRGGVDVRHYGLFIAEIDGGVTAGEERFYSRMDERIHKVFGGIPIAREATGFVRTVREASERHMVNYINLMRLAVFVDFMERHPDVSEETLVAYADFINVATGRGDISKLGTKTDALSLLFFSPRFTMSRIQIAPKTIKTMIHNEDLRKELVITWGSFLGTGMTVLALASLAGADVGGDPTDSDFGKIVIDDMRWDIWGGLQPPMRLFAQATMKVTMPSKTEDVDLWRAGTQFLKWKLSPPIGLTSELLTGEDWVNREPVGKFEALADSLTPIILQTAINSAEEGLNVGEGAMLVVPEFFGVGSNVYEKKSKNKKSSSGMSI